MSNETRQYLWPTAHEVALAIVTAARLEGEDPIKVLDAGYGSRARVYAFIALSHRFRNVTPILLADKMGARSDKFAGNARLAARGGNGAKWFTVGRLNAINEAMGWPSVDREAMGRPTYEGPPRAFGDAEPEIIPPEPINPERASRVARIGAWESGEPIEPPLVIGEVAVELGSVPVAALSDEDPLAAIKAKCAANAKARAPVAERAAQPEPKSEAECQPAAVPSRPAVVSDAARQLAAAAAVMRRPAIASASGMRGLGGVTVPRPVYPGSFSPPDAAPVVSYKPDAPARERNVDILTAEICGDPDFERSALFQKQQEQAKQGGARDVHSRR